MHAAWLLLCVALVGQTAHAALFGLMRDSDANGGTHCMECTAVIAIVEQVCFVVAFDLVI